MSKRRRTSVQIMYFQEYINKLAVNTTVSAVFKVTFACLISILLKNREKFLLRDSGMLQLVSEEHSHHLRVEGACCQNQEIQMIQAIHK